MTGNLGPEWRTFPFRGAAPGLRASLLWGIAHEDTDAILSALVGRALWGAA